MTIMKMKEDQENDKQFNWKLVLMALVVIVMLYFVASYAITQYKLPDRVIAYCQFNTTVNDDMPRDQCGYMKVVSRNINNVNIHDFEKFGKCSENFDDLPKCEGTTYHYSKYRLRDLCDGQDCDEIDGVVCNAFYITYHNESDPDRQEFEQNYFVKANLESEEDLMGELNKCNVGGKLPWQ